MADGAADRRRMVRSGSPRQGREPNREVASTEIGPMNRGTALLAVAALLLMANGCTPVATRGRLTADQRAAIKATPLLERPDRLGHIYGNTVRWLHYGHRNHNGRL